MSERYIHMKVPGPESVVISKEERYELIAQVARALEERRQLSSADYGNDWDASDTVFDFTAISQEMN